MTKASMPGVKVWDLSLRLFHWLLAGAILLAFVSAEEGSGPSQWHVASGWAAAVLIGFRVLWGFIGGQHARFASFVKPGRVLPHISNLVRGRIEPSLGHNPLGGMATLVLLTAVGAVVWSGISLTGGGENGEDLHEGIANALLTLVGLHVAGVIAMSSLSKDNLVKAMISGRKSRDQHPGAVDATSAPGVAIPVAAIAIAAGAYGVLQIDAAAFSPAAHGETGEQDSGENDD
jgi:cytochrome b